MSHRLSLLVVTIPLCLAGLALGDAQTAHVDQRVEGGGLGVPVDRTVEDLDPLGTSLRRIQPGPGQFHEAGRIRRHQREGWDAPHEPVYDSQTGLARPGTYQFSAPGVQAWMDRPSYYVPDASGRSVLSDLPAQDGPLAERIPAGTVFDLVPRPIDPAEQARRYWDSQIHGQPEPHDPDAPDHRIDGRVDGQVHQQINRRVEGRIEGRSEDQ